MTAAMIEHRPRIEGAEIGLVRLSPDGKRVAFVRHGLVEGIYLAEVGDGAPRKLSHFAAVDLAWSCDGARLAYRTSPRGHPAPRATFGAHVGWLDVDDDTVAAAPGDRRAAAIAFAWGTEPHLLFVADPDSGHIARIDARDGSAETLSAFAFHRDPLFRPWLAPSPDGQRLAFTSRNDFEDASWLHCITAHDGNRSGEPGVSSKPITWIPGARAHVFPFWSPSGRSLGMHVVHVAQQRTGTVVLRHMQGDGEIVYRHEAIDGARAPAWSPDGRFLALYRTVPLTGTDVPPGGRQQLVLVDLSDGSAEPLCEPDAVEGDLRFLHAGRLLIDGGACAWLLQVGHGRDTE